MQCKVSHSIWKTENPGEDIYRHPEAQRPASDSIPFKPIHDIYALSTIIIELACWRRTSSILKAHTRREADDLSHEDLMKIRELLIEISESFDLSFNIEFKAVTEFSNVVKRCLTGEFVTGEMKVISRLKRCHV